MIGPSKLFATEFTIYYLLTFLLVASFCWLIISTQKWHGRFTFDNRGGIQKFHDKDTARIGGIAIYNGLLITALFLPIPNPLLNYVILSSLPVLIAGLLDDLLISMRIWLRLGAAFLSAFFFILWSGYSANSISTPFIKYLFQWAPSSIIITSIALAGMCNAINIIDGFNGLASGALVIMFTTLGLLALQTNDPLIITYVFLHVAAVLGFMVWNFPFGKIFLGDAGAYYLGFALGAGTIMLFERNLEISPWTVILILGYPLMETIFSIYRKIRRKGYSPVKPDGVHLHHLMRRSYGRPLARRLGKPDEANSVTGALMWLFPLTSCILALIGSQLPPIYSALFLLAYIIGYLSIYQRVSLIYAQRKPYQESKNQDKR